MTISTHWPDNDPNSQAIFGNVAIGAITVDAIEVNKIEVNNAGYSFSGGTITFLQDMNNGGEAPEIKSDANPVFNSTLASQAGIEPLIVTGGGTVTFAGNNTFTNALRLSESGQGVGTTLVVTNNNALGGGNGVTIVEGKSQLILDDGSGVSAILSGQGGANGAGGGGLDISETTVLDHTGPTETFNIGIGGEDGPGIPRIINGFDQVTVANRESIRNRAGENTLRGGVFLDSAYNRINADDGTTLTIAGSIQAGGGAATPPPGIGGRSIAFGGSGNIILEDDDDDGGIGSGVQYLFKDGSGVLDLTRVGGNWNVETVLKDGTIIIDQQTDLGSFDDFFSIQPADGTAFGRNTFFPESELNVIGNSTLQVETGGILLTPAATGTANGIPPFGDVDLTGLQVDLVADSGADHGGAGVTAPPGDRGVGTPVELDIIVDGPGDVIMSLAGFSSDNAWNVVRKTGEEVLQPSFVTTGGGANGGGPFGDLVFVIEEGDPELTEDINVSTCLSPLFTDTELNFGDPAGAILDPEVGTMVIDNEGNPRTTVVVAGLGSTDELAPSMGTIELLNANLRIAGDGPTYFAGNIAGNGNIGFSNDTTLDSPNPDFSGQIVVHNGATLTVGHAGALGDPWGDGVEGNYDANGTYVCGGSTLLLDTAELVMLNVGGVDFVLAGTPTPPPGGGGSTFIEEKITLFNDGRIVVDNDDDWTIQHRVHIEHDANGSNSDENEARLGARSGASLVLLNGVNDHTGRNDMNLALNTGFDEAGTLVIDGGIGAGVQNVTIGSGLDSILFAALPALQGGPGANLAFGAPGFGLPLSTVILGDDSDYQGTTYLQGGGIVSVGDYDEAFSTGRVVVEDPVLLVGDGANLVNDFELELFEEPLIDDSPTDPPGIDVGPEELPFDIPSLIVASEEALRDLVGDPVNQFALAANGRTANGLNTDFDLGIQGVISGQGSLAVLGGTLSLTGENTYTGDTIAGPLGTLLVGNTLASTGLYITEDGVLRTTREHVLSNSASVFLGGRLVLGGDEGVLALNDYPDTEGPPLTPPPGVPMANVDNMGFNFAVGQGTFSGDITGAGDLIKNTNGTVTFNGSPLTYTGATQVEDGTLTLGATSGLASTQINVKGDATFNTGGANQLADGATLHVQSPSATGNIGGTETILTLNNDGRVNLLNGDLTVTNLFGAETGVIDLGDYAINLQQGEFAGNITNNHGTINKSGSGTMVLSGDNSVSGLAHIEEGILRVEGSLQMIEDIVIDAPGTLSVAGDERLNDDANLEVAGNLTLAGTETVNDVSLNGGTIGGGGQLIAGAVDSTGMSTVVAKVDADTIDVNFDTLTVEATGSIAADTITVDEGATLETEAEELIGNGSTLAVDGTVKLGGNETIATLNGGSTGIVDNNGHLLTVTDGTFAGDITGLGGLTKVGGDDSTLTLTGASTYSGIT
ncbi:MAG: hypothetical protein HKO57_03520, partial [Akkermansiaceae bacterium]|nr:hypothetical protein [Akkermansiaceae bacterium]